MMKVIKQLGLSETGAEVMFAQRYMTAHVLVPHLGHSGSVIASHVHTVIDNIWYRKCNHRRNTFDGTSAAVALYDSLRPEINDILQTKRISWNEAEERVAQVSKCETLQTAMQQQADDEQDVPDGFYDKPVYTSDEQDTMNTMNTMCKEMLQSVECMDEMSEAYDDFAAFALSLAQSAPISSLFEDSVSTMGN